MSDAFYVGAVGLQTQQQALDGIANNIANVNTPAFKRSQLRFSDVVATRANAETLAAEQAQAQTPNAVAGVALDSQFMINEQGELNRTGQAMDLAIEGRGFIELMGPGGQTLLWRGGQLKVNDDGLLATAHGLALRAGISVPADATAITIGSDGMVRATVPDSVDPVELGQIQLVRLDDAGSVDRLDGGLYRVREGSAPLTEAQPGEDGVGTFVQGAIEQSNVALTDEMVRLMLVQRAYAANAQIVQAADQLMAIANGLRR
ncbi:MAG: flagellar hook-basal body protein [Pseudomonadota bacterium]